MTAQETRCLSKLGERGLTAWVRRLEETDQVDKRRLQSSAVRCLPQPPEPAPSHPLDLLCAVALSETSTAFTNHSPAPSHQCKLGINLADLSEKLSLLHGQLEHKKRKLELLVSGSTPAWASHSKKKAASSHLVSSLTTSQLLAASRAQVAPLPKPSSMGLLFLWPSPPLCSTNLMLPGMQALPPRPHPAPEPQPKWPAPAPSGPSPVDADNMPASTPADTIRSTSSWAPPGVTSRPWTFKQTVEQLRARQTADAIRGYGGDLRTTASDAADGAAAEAGGAGAAAEAGGVAGSCRTFKVGGGAASVATPPGTLQERFVKYVMCGFTPRRPYELPMSDWVSCDELIGLLRPHAPEEVRDLSSETLRQLITEWYKDDPAFADQPYYAWCKKLKDKTSRKSGPRQARRSRSQHFNFPFQRNAPAQ